MRGIYTFSVLITHMTQITSNRLGISQPGSQWLGNSGCHGKRLHSVEDRAAPRCGSWPRNSIEVCTKSGRSECGTLWNGFVSSFPRFARLHVPCFSFLIVHAGSCEYWCACQKVSVLSRSALAKVRQINQKPEPSYVHRPWVQSTGKTHSLVTKNLKRLLCTITRGRSPFLWSSVRFAMAAVSQLLLCSWRCCSRVTDSWTVLDRQQKTMMIWKWCGSRKSHGWHVPRISKVVDVSISSCISKGIQRV